MSLDQGLEEALRRQQQLNEPNLYHILIGYAGQVRDEMQVLNYMKTFGIGITHADFWVRICRIFQNQCYFSKIVQIIIRIKSKENIENRYQIEQFEKTLLSDMRSTIHSQYRGKRSAKEFGIQRSSSKRMMGNIQIIGSNVQQDNDKLKSYAKLIESQMSQICRLQREQYQRNQMNKPLSFVATKDENLLKLTKQLFYAIQSPDYVDTSDDESFQLQHNPISVTGSMYTKSVSFQIVKQQQKQESIRDNIQTVTGELKDNAFIEYSELNDSFKQKQEGLDSKYDFELGFIIQQIQRETHEQSISKKTEQIKYSQKKESANKQYNKLKYSTELDAIPYKTDDNQSVEQIQELIHLIESQHKKESDLTQNNRVNKGNTIEDTLFLRDKKYKQVKISGNKKDQIAKFKIES